MGKLRGLTKPSFLRWRSLSAGKPVDSGALSGCGKQSRLASWGAVTCIVLLCAGATACATVRPEQRALLADPTMQHEDDTLDAEARQHVLENREGAFGGGSVRGGGCGCN